MALALFTLLNFTAKAQVDADLVGKEAPAFSLKNIDGKTVSLDKFPNAKGMIVIFTCNHCPYSVLYEDRIIALDAKYKAAGYPVVAINPNDIKQYPDDMPLIAACASASLPISTKPKPMERPVPRMCICCKMKMASLSCVM